MGANIEILNETAAVIDETLVIQTQMANPIYQGPQGPQGPAGNDGKTPVKGVDYFTSDDKQEIVDEVIENIGEVNVDLTDYYTKQETDAAIQAAKPDLTEYALKTDIPSLDGYAKTEDIPSLDGYATEEYVNEAIANIDIPEGGGASAAVDVSFDDTTAGIGATNVQEALDYLADTAIDADAVQEQIDENRTWDSATLLNQMLIGVVPNGVSTYSSNSGAEFFENLKTYGATTWYMNSATTDRPTYQQMYDEEYRYLLIANSDGIITLDKSLATYKTSTEIWNKPTYGDAVFVWGKSLILIKDYNGFRTALSKIYYNNSTSGLTATNIPAAIDELAGKINSLVDGNEVSY